MQFKVPQNVDIEDKILPFMTLRQMIICMVGGGITYLIYLALEGQSSQIWIPPVAVLGLLTVAIAFLKIKDTPFTDYILLVLERYLNETKRVWVKSAGDVFLAGAAVPKKQSKDEKKSKKSAPPEKKTSIQDINELSRMLDAGRTR